MTIFLRYVIMIFVLYIIPLTMISILSCSRDEMSHVASVAEKAHKTASDTQKAVSAVSDVLKFVSTINGDVERITKAADALRNGKVTEAALYLESELSACEARGVPIPKHLDRETLQALAVVEVLEQFAQAVEKSK